MFWRVADHCFDAMRPKPLFFLWKINVFEERESMILGDKNHDIFTLFASFLSLISMKK
jgi:hypothetical protein